MTVWTETEAYETESWAAVSAMEFESPFAGSVHTLAESEQSFPPNAESNEAHLPFASPFTGQESGVGTDPVREMVTELSSPELESALGELVQEASAIHADRTAMTIGESFTSGAQLAEQAVRAHLEPLSAATERMLETMAAEAGDREAATISESELSALLETYEAMPTPQSESPAFEQFFGAIKRLAKRALSGVVSLAKRGVSVLGKIIPLGAILRKLLKMVRPLVNRVLRFAIDRLPAALRPVAQQLKRRLLGFETAMEGEWESAESVAEVFEIPGTPTAESTATLEAEFVTELAHSLVGAGGATGALESGSFESGSFESAFETSAFESSPFEIGSGESGWTGESEFTGGGQVSGNEADLARIRLINELAALRDGESPGPAFEQFLPAILPALRLGITVVGRGRVVNFLAGFLAKILGRYVGPQLSRPLSQAIVSSGLRLLTLEAPNSAEIAHAGPAAVAAVVEDTVRKLGELPAEVFEDASRLETETMAAFNEAVAVNFPPSMVRSDLGEREVAQPSGMWALRPRVYWYKKYTHVFEVTLTPQMARSIVSFGGITLEAALRASHGFTRPIKAKVHLYESLRGTYLSRISALERHVPGMTPGSWRYFHPLSVQAATALLGEPGLGKDMDPHYLRDRNTIAAGQRFFYLQLPTPTGGGGGQSFATQAFLTLDGRPTRNLVIAAIYLSEPDAQAIASRARQGNTTAFVLALRAAFKAAAHSLANSPRSRVRVLKELEIGEAEGALAAIGGKILDAVISKIIDAVIRLATDYGRAKRDDFVRAVDDPRMGVTVTLTFPAPGLSTILRGGLLPSLAGIGAVRTLLGTLGSARMLPAIHTVPGMRRP